MCFHGTTSAESERRWSKARNGQKQELKKAGLKDLQAKHVELEVIPTMLEHKDKETFISTWKDSWKALKHQLRHDTARSRHQNAPHQDLRDIDEISWSCTIVYCVGGRLLFFCNWNHKTIIYYYRPAFKSFCLSSNGYWHEEKIWKFISTPFMYNIASGQYYRIYCCKNNECRLL